MFFNRLIDRRIEAYQSELIKKYCDEVENMYAKMRGWRHDYHNHIQAMQASMAVLTFFLPDFCGRKRSRGVIHGLTGE